MLTAGQLLHVLQELVGAFGPDLPITLNGLDEARPTQPCYKGVEQVATLIGSRDRTTPVRLVVLYATAARHDWYNRPEVLAIDQEEREGVRMIQALQRLAGIVEDAETALAGWRRLTPAQRDNTRAAYAVLCPEEEQP